MQQSQFLGVVMETGTRIFTQYGWIKELEQFDPKARYPIDKYIECPTCKGSGMVQHPAWKEYFDEVGSLNDEAIFNYFKDHWDRNIKSWNDLPPEEILCPDCEGIGELKITTDLRDVLKEMIKQIGGFYDLQ